MSSRFERIYQKCSSNEIELYRVIINITLSDEFKMIRNVK